MTEITLRPSLLAGVDITVKIIGVITGFLLPVIIPAIIEGRAVAAAAVFFGAQAISLYPALAAAALPAVQLGFTRYRLDDEGITTQTQVLSKSEKRVPWEKVTALRYRRTALDVLFRLERIDVVAYGERGATLHLVGLRGAAPIRALIAERMLASASVDSLFRGD